MMKRLIPACMVFVLWSFLPSGTAAEEILTWEDCLAEATKNHPDLISAAETVNQRKADRAVTAGALYPQIDANVDASTAQTGTTAKTTADTYTYGVSGTQLIFDGFKTVNEVNAAKEDIKAARENYRWTSSEVRLNLRGAFISLLKAQEMITVAEEIVNIRRDSLMMITLNYEAGLEHKGAQMTAEANWVKAKAELARTKRGLALAQRQLSKEMGWQEVKAVAVKGDFVVRDRAEEPPDFAALAEDNPSLLEALARKNSAAFDVKSAYAEFSPALSAAASANKKGAHWPPENENWSLGFSLTMPIYEGGLRWAQVSKAKAVYNQLAADARSARDGVVVALEQYWAALRDALDTVEVEREDLEAAEERAKIAEAQYSTGFIAFDNWIIIENDLVEAKKAYLNAQAGALSAEAEWMDAKGETLEYAQK